mmetsp:Transcript_66823/g.134194  ORF Transcript_66823/g.134194 Transcript_66823/m.134194 type:complete len:133 (+) Transcript_66823:75-473(+)
MSPRTPMRFGSSAAVMPIEPDAFTRVVQLEVPRQSASQPGGARPQREPRQSTSQPAAPRPQSTRQSHTGDDVVFARVFISEHPHHATGPQPPRHFPGMQGAGRMRRPMPRKIPSMGARQRRGAPPPRARSSV